MNIQTTDGHTILITNKDYFKLQHHDWHLNDDGYPVNEDGDLMIHIIHPRAIRYVSDDKMDNRHENIELVIQKTVRFWNVNKVFGKDYVFKGDTREDGWPDLIRKYTIRRKLRRQQSHNDNH